MADALASGASARKGVGVQVPPRARYVRRPLKVFMALLMPKASAIQSKSAVGSAERHEATDAAAGAGNQDVLSREGIELGHGDYFLKGRYFMRRRPFVIAWVNASAPIPFGGATFIPLWVATV